MGNMLSIIQNLIDEQNLKFIYPIEPEESIEQYTYPTEQYSLNKIKNEELKEALQSHLKTIGENQSRLLLTNILGTPRMIINTGHKVIATINVKKMTESIDAMLKEPDLPFWRKKVKTNNLLKELYKMFLLETASFRYHFEEHNRDTYDLIGPDEYYLIATKAVEIFIKNKNELVDILHLINYMYLMYKINYPYLRELTTRRELLTEFMKETMVDSIKKYDS